VRVSARGAFQRRNFALARAAAEAHLRHAGIALDERAVLDAAASTEVPGRLQVVGEAPLTVLDGAHNPDAVTALVEAMPEVFGTTPPALVLGVLEDKDAAGMLRQLLPVCARTWFTAPPGDRALSPAALESRARQLGFAGTVCEPRPERALAAAREWAAANGTGVLATGSVYLVGHLLGLAGEPRESVAAEPGELRARRVGG
jgi:dihydrofolate synthase/folylpolyglutamate synthase